MTVLQTCLDKPETRLATSLLALLFKKEELLEEVNVNGKAINRSTPKDALDPQKIEIIKKSMKNPTSTALKSLKPPNHSCNLRHLDYNHH